jgi:hypothetical protein
VLYLSLICFVRGYPHHILWFGHRGFIYKAWQKLITRMFSNVGAVDRFEGGLFLVANILLVSQLILHIMALKRSSIIDIF